MVYGSLDHEVQIVQLLQQSEVQVPKFFNFAVFVVLLFFVQLFAQIRNLNRLLGHHLRHLPPLIELFLFKGSPEADLLS
jgi:hypothetical protein